MESCQNCNETITGNFCANCGQKTSVHRYSFKHFITHDLIHGIWTLTMELFLQLKNYLQDQVIVLEILSMERELDILVS